MAKYNSLKINTINRETDKCVTLSFDIPDDLKKEYIFKAGQYITLKTTINGEEIRRDYSLCASPKSGTLKVAVKEVENGTFSKYANKDLKIGDGIEVSSPNGRFIFEPDTNKSRTVVAFAAGSGITPILSILKTVLEEEHSSKFVLVLYSQAQEENALFGRIEKSTVNLIVKNRYKDTVIDSFYICGPEVMINTVKTVLVENNISEDNIHFELFTDAPYSCQGGVCSSCIARISEGTATMRQNNILTDSEVAEGLVLTCQAHPTSSTLKVDYDDV